MILSDLVRVAGSNQVNWIWLASRHEQTPLSSGAECHVLRIDRRYETAYRPLRGIAGEIISAVSMRAMRPAFLRNCELRVQEFLRSTSPDYLVCVLDCPAAVQVAARLARSTPVPMLSIVWDDVEVFSRHAAFDRWTSRQIKDDFAFVLKSSRQVAVICENMQSAYADRYGISSLVLRHGLPRSRIGEHASNGSARQDRWWIGFAGSVTAPDCLRSLIEALDALDWKFQGREIGVRLLGARYLVDSRKSQCLEFLGWRSVRETVRFLAACDLLFLPQSFQPELRILSELSFPTKLSTYVAANRPIFLHAPTYASLSTFWQQHELGPVCASLDCRQVGGQLTASLAAGAEQIDRWTRNIAHVHDEVLSATRFEQSVHELLGLGEQMTGDRKSVYTDSQPSSASPISTGTA